MASEASGSKKVIRWLASIREEPRCCAPGAAAIRRPAEPLAQSPLPLGSAVKGALSNAKCARTDARTA